MAKMKGLFKGIKYISQIFVSKEHEMEIGNPTNVRHVAHIGYDSGASVSSPSWMKEFKTSSDFSSTSLENLEQSKQTSCASPDFNPRAELQRPAEVLVAKAPKKVKRKKPKASSPSSTLRPSGKPSKTRASCAASLGVEDGIPEPILVN